MPQSSIAVPTFEAQTDTGLNLNSLNDVTPTFNVADFQTISYQLVQNSGNSTTWVVIGQCSADGTNFVDISGKSLTNVDGVVGEITVGTEFFRVRVSTAEGTAAIATVTTNAKR